MHNELVYADLHAHTHCSDGMLDPEVLVKRATERGVEVLAVTDHDTTDGLDRAKAATKEQDIDFVTGVELSVEVDDRTVHLLGYGFDSGHTAITDYLDAFSRRRWERLDQMIRHLTELGVGVESEVVERHVGTSSAPGRPHLARALVDEGHVDSYQAAFEQYLDTNQPAYVPAPTQPAAKAIEVLHTAGGVAVLAHPGQWTPTQVLKALRKWGLDGIECYSPSHPDYLVDYYRTICHAHDLVITGGSDYHGGSDHEETDLGSVGLTRRQWERFRDAAL